jgi:hypothetical protein
VEMVNLPVVVLIAVNEGEAGLDGADGARNGVGQANGPVASASGGVAIDLGDAGVDGADRALQQKGGKVLAHKGTGVTVAVGDGGKQERAPSMVVRNSLVLSFDENVEGDPIIRMRM